LLQLLLLRQIVHRLLHSRNQFLLNFQFLYQRDLPQQVLREWVLVTPVTVVEAEGVTRTSQQTVVNLIQKVQTVTTVLLIERKEKAINQRMVRPKME
jgi:hypothetical protein